METDSYLGSWELVPELCIYQQGEAPRSGLYRIAEAEGVISISIDWIDREGVEHHMEFGGVPDGSEQPADAPGVTHVTLTRISSSTLDSAAYNGGEQIMYARRVAHDDLLSTLQRNSTNDRDFSVFQVYRRVAA